jgi:hypothetical protein
VQELWKSPGSRFQILPAMRQTDLSKVSGVGCQESTKKGFLVQVSVFYLHNET